MKAPKWMTVIVLVLLPVNTIVLTGCAAVSQALATPTGLEPTLQAISVMLTQTSAAPTATSTHTPAPSAAPTETPTPTSTVVVGMRALPAKMGQPLEASGIEVIVLSARLVDMIEDQRSAAGSRFVIVDVRLRGQTDAGVSYNPSQFKLTSEDGTVYEPVPGIAFSLLRGILRLGEVVRGSVVFSVPEVLAEQNQPETAIAGGLQLTYTREPGQDVWVDLGQRDETIPETGGDALNRFPADMPGPGERVQASGIALTINGSSLEERVGSRRAPDGKLYLLVNVTLENTERTRSPFNAQYFKLRVPQGFEYPAVILPLDDMLQAGSLGEGEQVTGQVVFEIPEDVRQGMITYQPLVITEEYAELRFKIDF